MNNKQIYETAKMQSAIDLNCYIVASIDLKYEKIVRDYIDKCKAEHCFETPNMHVINDAFSKDGLPKYRRQGIASALTSRLALEIIKRDKVPFYCCAWSNVKSARNAIKSGFRPARVEMTVKSNEFIDEMNR